MMFIIKFILLDYFLSKYYDYDMIMLISLEVHLAHKGLRYRGSSICRGWMSRGNPHVP